MKRILITGGSSLLAHCWTSDLDNNIEYILGINKTKPIKNLNKYIQLNYASENKLEEQIKLINPNVIINCIGLTSVEQCENEPEEAFYVNALIPELLSKISSNLNIKFVHISTDHLFSGVSPFSTEKAEVNPLNQYAKTKIEGECRALEINKDCLIIRTNFFGFGSKNKFSFSDVIINSLKEKKSLSLFEDVFFTPISVLELKKHIYKLIDLKKNGIFNISSSERISKFDFGILIAEIFSFEKKLIKPISICEIDKLVLRPKDMSLSNIKFVKTTGNYILPLDKQIKQLRLSLK
jgi:dTDP-4-dehydrorhamnose reductase